MAIQLLSPYFFENKTVVKFEVIEIILYSSRNVDSR